MISDATALATTHDDAVGPASRQVDEVIASFARAVARVHFPETDTHGNPNLGRFLLDHGRLPAVDDEIKPWAYCGWLVPYIQLCELHPDIPARYDYVLRTVDAGELLDEQIPQVNFVSEHSTEARSGMKMLADMVKIAEYRSGYSRLIESVVEWLAFAAGVSHEPSKLEDRDQEQLYRLFDVSKWLLAPTDYLGQHMAEVSYGKAGGFFPTPMSICTVMAKMTYDSGKDPRHSTAMDCAVGTGRLLLAASNFCLRLFGQDINYLCVLASKVNLAIYAPWHLIPERFFPAPEPIELPVEPAEQIHTTKIEQPMLFDLFSQTGETT